LAREAKKRIAPGEFEVDTSLRLNGPMTLRAPGEYTPTADVPWTLVVTLLLHRMGFQRDAAGDILVELATKALELSGDSNREKREALLGDYLVEVEACKDRMNDAIGKLPKKTRMGKTTVNFEIAPLKQATVIGGVSVFEETSFPIGEAAVRDSEEAA